MSVSALSTLTTRSMPLTDSIINRIDDRPLHVKGIDVSYFFEGYSEFRTEDL